MAMLLLYVAFLPFVVAYLQVTYPFNQQLPSAAHANIPYQFHFAPTTSQSDAGRTQYSLVGGPSWLLLDSTSRTLSGTPRARTLERLPLRSRRLRLLERLQTCHPGY